MGYYTQLQRKSNCESLTKIFVRVCMVLHFKQVEKVFAYFTKKVYNRPDYILGGTLIMLDIKFLRENPDIVKQNIKNKFQDPGL